MLSDNQVWISSDIQCKKINFLKRLIEYNLVCIFRNDYIESQKTYGAWVAELVDARDLKSLARMGVRVRFSSRAPIIERGSAELVESLFLVKIIT